MATPEQEALQDRKKKTVWLMAAGAVSLLIPLAGAFYLHWSQNAGAPGPSGRSDIFERREGDDRKIIPTQSAVVSSPPGLISPSGMNVGAAGKPAASSLDFIEGNADMLARISGPKAAVAAAPVASTAPVALAAAPVAPVAAAKTKKPRKKAFTMPKLKPSRGFTNFGSTGVNGTANAGAQAGTASGQSPQDLLRNIPPGAQNDPRIQQYLKNQQGQ